MVRSELSIVCLNLFLVLGRCFRCTTELDGKDGLIDNAVDDWLSDLLLPELILFPTIQCQARER